MSFNDDSIISLDEVNQALEEIENRYSPITKCDINNEAQEELFILSKELDTVGLPIIDISKPVDLVLHDVIESSRALIHLHRKTLSKITDADIDIQSRNRRITELNRTISELKSKLNSNENKGLNLENKLLILQNKNTALLKRESELRDEMEKLKKYHSSKQNETLCQYKKLLREHQHLKNICNKDLSLSKDEVLMNMLQKYRENEEIYKNTIQKLQENNQTLMEEILELRQESVNFAQTKRKY